MTELRSREDFIEAARYVPKNLFGVVTAVGYLLFFLGVGALIHGLTVQMDPTAFRIDWRIALAGMVGGGALMATASVLMQRGFRQAARTAGFSAEQIREIEAEAQRRNAAEEFEGSDRYPKAD